jgi:hypothetical protein
MTTEAGKRLLNNVHYANADDIAAVEAEAFAAERERIRTAVEGLDGSEFIDDYGDADWPGTTYFGVDRAAVLRIIEGETP